MNINTAVTGNTGPGVRSDCEISLELTQSGGLLIDLNSKVKVLYGDTIRQQCVEILDFFGIKNANLRINDSGALPFVISARLEAAVKQLTAAGPEYLPEFAEDNKESTARDRFRITRLYIPGNTPALMINAGLHSADGLILDLEDSVSPDKKEEARFLVRNALRRMDFGGAEKMVRINQGEYGIKDLDFIVPHHVNLILIPKCESPDHLIKVHLRIEELRSLHGISAPVHLMPIIETALGVERAYEIAKSTDAVVALAIGLEDLGADLGITRTIEGKETLYARSRVVNASKAAGIQPIDSVFPDVGDMESLLANAKSSKALGFEGMGCIHPRQIKVVRAGFSPGADETERSKKIVLAWEKAIKNGSGVTVLGTRMIDLPVVLRARKVIDLSVRLGILSPEWMNDASESLTN